jgi:hypothetical protein
MQIPEELAAYLQELGDGFSIQWEMPDTGDLVSFGLSSLEDTLQEHPWHLQQLREICETQKGEGNEIAQEARRRMDWIPIIGIGEGGYYFCLDTHKQFIRYHESYWQHNPAVWQSSLAPSLLDLVRNWSRFCFSEPILDGSNVSMTIFAGRLKGQFDWAPSCFDARFDRQTTSC